MKAKWRGIILKYKYILFDLDGTLTDPKLGITKSVAFALDRMGYYDVNLEELTKFIGPPLVESFVEYYNFSEEEADQAVQYYREYFKDRGIYENKIYSGIEELLKVLKENGKELIVATSKPTVFAEVIIDHFNLTRYFSGVIGSNLDGTRVKKAEVIEAALKEIGITNKEDAVMIGDRKHDIIGAKENGIDSIGVEYGYGNYDELKKAGADFIVSKVDDLRTLLIK
jgi:phosphoglycolate phosphatase